MSGQPVALQLADDLEAHAEEVEQANGRLVFVALTLREASQLTAELRRLAAVEAQRDAFLVALRDMLLWLDDGQRVLSDACAADVATARAAIAKAEGA